MSVTLDRVAPADPLTPVGSVAPAKASHRLRLEFLDGLRGLSALYVVFHHAANELQRQIGPFGQNPFMKTWLNTLQYGHFAVAVFIVLSGYCLMLPVARAADGQLRDGFWNYLKRRARRILPPYYAALALCLLLIALTAPLRQSVHVQWEHELPVTTGAVLSHLFLVHNWIPDYVWRINSPMWSVATEWQIYFFFPLLLLPVWRRFGMITSVLVGFAVGLAPHFLFHEVYDLAYSWYLGLFALGMAAAAIGFSERPWERAIRARISWGKLTLGFVAALAVEFALWHHGYYNHWCQIDAVVGLLTACLIGYCVEHASKSAAKRPLPLRLFESRFALCLGGFSYSLYLIHMPLLAAFHLGLLWLHLSVIARAALLFTVGPALATLLSYLFYLAFERPFLVRQRGEKPTSGQAEGGPNVHQASPRWKQKAAEAETPRAIHR